DGLWVVARVVEGEAYPRWDFYVRLRGQTLARLPLRVHRDRRERPVDAPLHHQRLRERDARAREQAGVAARGLYGRREARLGLVRAPLLEQQAHGFEPPGGRVVARPRRAVILSARDAAGHVRTLRHHPVWNQRRF